MVKIQNHRLLLSLSLLLLTACSGAKQEEPADAGVSTLLPAERNEVTVATLRRQPFSHELVSNGKIAAGGMADLRFESTGIVAHIYVKNGDHVRRGQKLAELAKFRLATHQHRTPSNAPASNCKTCSSVRDMPSPTPSACPKD